MVAQAFAHPACREEPFFTTHDTRSRVLARGVLLIAVLLLGVTVLPPPAAAFDVVCLGTSEVVCFAYRVVVEIKDGRARVELYDEQQNEQVAAVCVDPPHVWVGNCASPPGPPGEELLLPAHELLP